MRTRLIMIFLLMGLFGVLTALMLSGNLAAFESGVYAWLVGCASPSMTSLMTVITHAGSAFAVLAIVAVLMALPSTRDKFGITVAVNVALSAGLNLVLKMIIARDRPDVLRLVEATGYGFPSGHAMNSAALFTIILLVAFATPGNKPTRAALGFVGAVVPLLIGVSRVYLGVHSAGDVLAGWVMGVAVACMTDTVRLFVDKRRP